MGGCEDHLIVVIMLFLLPRWKGLFYFTSNAEAARATTLILGKSKPEPKIDILPTAEEENASVSEPATSNLSNETINVGNVTKLTGVPQIDYIYDPNLPRELNGYNLTDYPFYNSVPEDIDFKCDGLHDGFYASVPHKCQVYHHCLFGTRYDFLCANYTAFDQKTFICHFASEVDCKNSPRYFNRNEALYKAATTTTVSPLGSSLFAGNRRPQAESQGGRRRRPYRRRKPSYEYYDEYEDLAEDDYYDEGSPARRRKRPRPFPGRDSYDDAEEEGSDGEKPLPPSGPNKSVYDRPRIAPKIRRPVPVNERDKYDYSSDSRAIVKEPPLDKKRFEETESSNRKQTSNRAPEYYESTGSGHAKNKEPDTEREREREHKGDDYERERERDRERERERERDDRPFRDRRPPKKRRRPDGLDDEYDEYDDGRRHRPNRNRQRYEEYDEYEYDDRPYRQRNRDQDYRPRDHDYDRDKPYRNRDSDYERPIRNRDRVRDDDRPIRNRDVDDRPVRNRDEERPLRSRDEERPIRNRDQDKPKEQDDRSNRNRNEQSFRTDGKVNKNRNRDDERHYYGSEEDRYRERDESKRVKDTYRDGGKKTDEEERPYKYSDDDVSQEDTEKYPRPPDRNRSPERPPRYREGADKFVKGRTPPREEAEEPKIKQERIPEGSPYGNPRPRPADQTERPFRGNDRGTPRPGTVQRNRNPSPSTGTEDSSVEEQSKPVPASRPAYITKPTEAPTRKPFVEQNVRKQNSFKRPFLPRTPTVQDDSSEQSPPQTADGYEERPFERPKFESESRDQPPQQPQQAKFYPPEDIRGTIEQLNEKLLPVAPEEQPRVDFGQPKLKVPHEDSVPKEELAPRAPKFPQTSPRRRPFLPSRNGNANLPRNLLPVGVKALQTPRGFQAPNKKEENEQQPATESFQGAQEKERQDPRYQFPGNGGVEFRAKLSTAIGVDQPKLTQFYQDVQSSSELELPEYDGIPQNAGASAIDIDYYSSLPQKQQEEGRPGPQNPASPPRQYNQNNANTQDLSSSRLIPEYSPGTGQGFRQESNPGINFRPALKPTDFPPLGIADGPPPPPPQVQEKNLEQAFRNRPLPSAINQQFTGKNPVLFPPPPPKPAAPQQQQPQPQLQSQLGPQSFFSENPKFKTTIKAPEPFPYKPSGPNVNFNPAAHPPVFQGGLRPNLPLAKPEAVRYENAQRQIDPPQENQRFNLKFPSQSENPDDTDEFDVSLNDALQPISTLHPRNVPTGVYLSNWQRNQQQSGGFNRRVFQGASLTRRQSDSRDYEGGRPDLPQRAAAESRNGQNQPKNQKPSAQRQASSNVHQRYVQPPAYHPPRPVTSPGKYFAILTQ